MKRVVWSLTVLLVAAWVTVWALPAGPAAAQEGDKTPPQSYEEVAEQVAALEKEALAAHEEIVAQFLAQDFEGVYARMNDEARGAITMEQLQTAYQQLTAFNSIGERLDYRAMAMSPNANVLMALYSWGQMPIRLITAIDAAGQISGLYFQLERPLPDDPAADFVSPVSFRLPFEGLWYVGWGGPDALHNYHVEAAPQRHAYDFLVWKDGSTFMDEGTANEDYYAFGQPIFAPADGTVVRAVSDLPDVLPQVETDSQNPAGNHVVIQVGEGMYLFIAHMQQNSVLVAEGDTVTAGQMIGLVGNSGNTSEPHIHIHLQNTPEMFTYDDAGAVNGLSDAIGLPLAFSGILINGEPVEMGVPLGGQFVQPDPNALDS